MDDDLARHQNIDVAVVGAELDVSLAGQLFKRLGDDGVAVGDLAGDRDHGQMGQEVTLSAGQPRDAVNGAASERFVGHSSSSRW
jgi:hypothetical protein